MRVSYIYAAIAAIVFIVVTAFGTTLAEAHEISKKQCTQYAIAKPGNDDYGQYKACRKWAIAHMNLHPLPISMIPPTLRRIRYCESHDNYRAANKHSTASGAYQYLDSTWSNGSGYKRAMYAPPRIQDLRAVRDFNRVGGTPWNASKHCWG